MKYKPNQLSEAAFAASRQMWLAGLGAAVVSRDWIQAEAGNTFKNLVKEGTVVESRAIRFLGDQLETGMTRANTLWRHTRAKVQSGVRNAADATVSFVKETLPRSLPGTKAVKAAKPVKRMTKRPARKPVAKRAAKKRAVH